jgi:hypothetical protein
LENSRTIAGVAAVAWAKEADNAERSDARKLKNALLHRSAANVPDAEERAMSENPDRGFA